MRILFATLLTLWLSVSFAQKNAIPYSRNGMVEFVSGDKNTLTVTTQSFADKEAIAFAYAERNALENILFRGIPKSNQENPMVADEDKARSSSLDRLINQDYKKYLISSFLVEKHKQKKVHYVTLEVKFDINALRKYLEDNGIVRKFGF
jgi:hypothetical protein